MYWLNEAEDVDFLAGEEELITEFSIENIINLISFMSVESVYEEELDEEGEKIFAGVVYTLKTKDGGEIEIYNDDKMFGGTTIIAPDSIFISQESNGAEHLYNLLDDNYTEVDGNFLDKLENHFHKKEKINEAEDIDFLAGEEELEMPFTPEYVATLIEHINHDVGINDYENVTEVYYDLYTPDDGEMTIVTDERNNWNARLIHFEYGGDDGLGDDLHTLLEDNMDKLTGKFLSTLFEVMQNKKTEMTEAEDFDFLAGEEELQPDLPEWLEEIRDVMDEVNRTSFSTDYPSYSVYTEEDDPVEYEYIDIDFNPSGITVTRGKYSVDVPVVDKMLQVFRDNEDEITVELMETLTELY